MRMSDTDPDERSVPPQLQQLFDVMTCGGAGFSRVTCPVCGSVGTEAAPHLLSSEFDDDEEWTDIEATCGECGADFNVSENVSTDTSKLN